MIVTGEENLGEEKPRKTGVTVLFAGQYWPGANTLYIARAFESCGATVRILNETGLYPSEWQSLGSRIIRKALMPIVAHEWNAQLIALAEQIKPDLIYMSNSYFVHKRTLKIIRSLGIPIMCFYHDVSWNRPGDNFEENISSFDLVTTTRPWQKPLIFAAGGRAVKVVRFGYEPLVHRPVQPDDRAIKRYASEVTFVGTMEKERSQMLQSLVSHDFPYKFRLWGGYWNRLPNDSPLLAFWQRRAIQEGEMPLIYATGRIALHWICRDSESNDEMMCNGDGHNSRSFQIPACGGALMLAQRTKDHLRFFKEDQEAIFFDDLTELKEKIKFWLDPSREKARLSIVNAARKRCVQDDYTYIPVVREYLEHFRLPVSI